MKRIALLISLLLPACAFAAGPPRPVVDSPFFAFSVYDRDPATLGYRQVPYLYANMYVLKDPPYPKEVEQRLEQARANPDAPKGFIWLTVSWTIPWQAKPTEDPESKAKAMALLRKIADKAAAVGWHVSIYPHTGDTLCTARQALKFLKELNYPNVKLTMNLAHELRNGQVDDLLAVVDEVKDSLSVVTINGADRPGKGEIFGWERLIQPLGRGDFDVFPLLQKLQAIGYTGPVGLQCYGIKEPSEKHLVESMKAWRAYCERLSQ